MLMLAAPAASGARAASDGLTCTCMMLPAALVAPAVSAAMTLI